LRAFDLNIERAREFQIRRRLYGIVAAGRSAILITVAALSAAALTALTVSGLRAAALLPVAAASRPIAIALLSLIAALTARVLLPLLSRVALLTLIRVLLLLRHGVSFGYGHRGPIRRLLISSSRNQ
jgi:hypothetical protein